MPAIPTSSDIMLETPQQMPTNPTSSDIMLEPPQQMPTIPTSSELLLDASQQMPTIPTFGQAAGYEATNAYYSNLFGYQVGKTFSGNNIGGNNIIIGTNISLGDAVANSMNIGGVLFGTGFNSDTSGDPIISPVAGGKIGIGTNSPNNTLEINSGSTTNSGLRFTQLNASSSTSTPNGKALSVKCKWRCSIGRFYRMFWK